MNMNEYLQLIAAFTGSAGFALAYNFRGRRHMLMAGLGGFLGWLCYLTVYHISGNGYLAGYTGTVLVSLYSEAAARILRTPATGLLIVTSMFGFPSSLFSSSISMPLSRQFAANVFLSVPNFLYLIPAFFSRFM